MTRVLFLLSLPALALIVWPAIAAAQATPAPAAKVPPKSPPAVAVAAVTVTAPQACTAGGCGASGGPLVRAVARVHVFAETRPVRGLFWRVRERFHFRGRCG